MASMPSLADLEKRMTDDVHFSESEADDLRIHVEKCALRFRELRNLVAQNMKRLVRLEVWMVSGMTAIIGLLTKLAFWPE
jgi:hypothetical protein